MLAGENENSFNSRHLGRCGGGRWRRKRTHNSTPQLITSVGVISGRPANIRAVALICIPYHIGNMAAQLMNSTVSGGERGRRVSGGVGR